MQTVTLAGRDGIGLAADVVGHPAAPPVLLFHGGGQTRHAWGTTLEVLGEGGWHADSVDLRGHGQSDWDKDGDYTLDAFSADIRTIALSIGEPPALVGASLGGLVLAYFLTGPSAAAAGFDPRWVLAVPSVLVFVGAALL